MKILFKLIQPIIILGLLLIQSCSKNDLSETDKDIKAFSDSIWTFDVTGDTLKDKIIGMWLSEEVSYDDQQCYNCDSLFTWVIESTGNMVKRNNDFGDFETRYGQWTFNENKEVLLFSWEVNPICGTCKKSSITMIDSIKITYSINNKLWTSEYINDPPTTKMDIKFNKINK
jgi:hypothetical protein